MAHTHAHPHAHPDSAPTLGFALALTGIVLLILLIGGYYANSLALWADAGHVVTDFAALGLSWYAMVQALRPAHPARSFGYHRTGILVAVVNALSLLLIAVVIGIEAYQRVWVPEPVQSQVMVVAAGLGLAINLVIAQRLHAHQHGNLNMRSAYLHVFGDALASLGVIVGAVVIGLTGWLWVDPLLSAFIAAFIAVGAYQVLDESVDILMEGSPSGMDPEAVRRALLEIDGVQAVHELHLWSIAQHLPSLSCHVVIDLADVAKGVDICTACGDILAERFKLFHSTIQVETHHCHAAEVDCKLAAMGGYHGGHPHGPRHGHGG